MSNDKINVDRRAFVGKMTLSISGITVSALLPASILQASPMLTCASYDRCGDWQLDDICNSYPPYSHQIQMTSKAAIVMGVDSADWHWIF